MTNNTNNTDTAKNTDACHYCGYQYAWAGVCEDCVDLAEAEHAEAIAAYEASLPAIRCRVVHCEKAAAFDGAECDDCYAEMKAADEEYNRAYAAQVEAWESRDYLDSVADDYADAQARR